jgi:anti-anti-sigma factor
MTATPADVDHDGVVVVRLGPDLSALTVRDAAAHLDHLLAPATPPVLVVNLSGVGSCDGGGALVLDAAARMAARDGRELRLAAPAASVCQALHRAGIMRTIATYATVAGAQRADPLDLLEPPTP